MELQDDTRGINIVSKNILNGKEGTIFKNTFQHNDASEWMNQLRGLKNLSQQVLSSRLIFFCPKADLAKHHQTVISEDESWESYYLSYKTFSLEGFDFNSCPTELSPIRLFIHSKWANLIKFVFDLDWPTALPLPVLIGFLTKTNYN